MKPTVGALSLFALGVNGIVGVGIFFTPNLIAAIVPGPAGALIFLATAALLLPIALIFAALGRALPIDGGPYVWAKAAFGDGVALGVGWVAAVSALLSLAAVIAGLRDHLGPALGVAPGAPGAAFAVSCVALFGAVAALGLRPSAWTWDVLTLVKLAPLALLVALFAVASGPPALPRPAAPAAGGELARALLLAVFPLQGFEIVPVLAGSAARGRSSVPVATIGSLAFAALLYAGIQLTCALALPDLANEHAPLVAAARALGGPGSERVVALGTNLSAIGIAFGMMVMTPRYLAALGGEAGFGGWLGRLDARGVPRAALLFTMIAVGVLVTFEALGSLFVLSSAAVLVQYSAALFALARLAHAREYGLSRLWLAPALLGFGAIVLLAHSVEPRELSILAGALGVGLALALGRARLTRSTPRRG